MFNSFATYISYSKNPLVRDEFCRIVHSLCVYDAITITRPERPKGAKDEVKQAQMATNWKLGPGGAPKLLV